MQHVPLGALFELVTAELGLSQRSSSDDVAAALREFAVDLERAVPLLCEWTSARLEAPWLPLPFSPEKQRALLVRLLVDLVFELLRRRSGYLQVEDLHWADQSTLDWLGLLFGAIVERGGFAVMTARPDFIPPWDVPDLLVFEMSPLSPDEVAEMVASLPTGHGMSSQVIEQIVARADGVPLFVEELAAVFADHLEDAPTRDALPEVPATLRDLLMSRLDALGPAKATAQVAAAIGREFDQDLLRASVPGKDEATLLADLAQLVSYRLVITRRAVGYQRYSFRHALVRDAAYESMLPPHREIVHARVADALLHEFPERVEKRPDLVALQLELAGLAFQAQSYWLSAGRLALREVAYDEARAYLQRGLDVLGQCPAGVARTDAELDLLGAMSAAHIAKLGYGAPQLGQLMAQVEALTEGGTASSGHALPLLWGRYLYHAVQPDHRRSLLIANSMLERSAQTGDRAFSLQGHSAAIRNHFWRGEFVEALAHFDALSSLGDPELIRSLRPITGEDPHWAGAGFSALCLLITGRTAEGMGLTAQVAQSAHDTGLPGLAQASWTGFAHSHLLRGLADPTGSDLERAVDFGRRAREGAAELGFPFWQAYGGLMEAAAMICGGQLEGIVQMEAMMAMFAGAGARVGLGWNLDTLAYGYMQAGDLEKAASMLARSRDHAQQSGEDFYSSINARFEGRLAMLRSGGGDTAEVRLRESVAIASRQGARLFEAQSMVQLLELFERQGRPNADLEALCASASWQNSHSQDLAAVPSLARLFRSACQPIERRGGTRTEAEVGLES
jgi:tetratricopeptide (TPR) repeat protein